MSLLIRAAEVVQFTIQYSVTCKFRHATQIMFSLSFTLSVGRRTTTPPIKSKSQVDVAELLNNFFTEIGPNLSRNVENVETTHEEFLHATDKEFVFEETTSAHIFSLLSKLCKSKATGLDNISAELLRECPDLIAASVTYIFNQSLLTGIFPDEWKSARVTPLYKNSGKRNDPT